MKRLLTYLTGFLVLGGACFAEGPLNFIPLEVSNVATNGGLYSTNTYSHLVYGEVQGLVVDISGYASPTVTVTVASSSAGMLGVAQTILSIANITADAVYPVTDLKCSNAGVDITGEPAPIVLWGDTVSLVVDNNTTNAATDVKVWLILK